MKFIHIADIHASKERLPQTLSILSTLTKRTKKDNIDFIIFAGDFWDSTITATKGSGFSDIIAAVRELEKNTRLYFLYGTPTHEPNGSLDAFMSERTRVISSMCSDIFTDKECSTDICFIPEPRRNNYVGKSAQEINESINSKTTEFIKSCGNKKSGYNRVVVYHGEVKGAVYQNGMTASSPTAISKELLQSLKADYYAFGHIHLPQEVFPNAWYAGSACPKDFGETHDGCFNLVTIENGETKVERSSFGLPQYYTIKLKDIEALKRFHTKLTSFKRYNLRLQVPCTKEEKKTVNVNQIANLIKSCRCAKSVKIEFDVHENDVLPKSEVVKHKSIVEKMSEYAKEKNLKLPKHAKELLQDIQDRSLIKFAYPQHSFELLSLSLRGSIGIRNGQHKEDFELNLEQYEDGVVCLIGDNGHGKSTLIENCHPYPRMLTREGTLKEHFYLKDSHRILIYKDENDLYYRISMLVDGKTASGKTSYFVETSKDRETWNPVSNVDGSLESYKQWVEQTFGSVDIFLRTAFFAKEQVKNTPDIANTTKGERMELLSKLAGTDYLKEVSGFAKKQREEVECSAAKIEMEIDSYSRYEEIIKSNTQNIINWNNELIGQKQAVSDMEKTVAELKLKDIEYQKVKAVAEANKVLKERYEEDIANTTTNLEYFEGAVKNKDMFDKVAFSRKVIATNAPLIEGLTKKLNEINKKIGELTDATLREQKKRSEKTVTVNRVKSEIEICKSQIVDVDETCPTCGQPISGHKKQELLSHVNKSKKNLEELENELSKEQELLSTINDCIKKIEAERDDVADERMKIEGNLTDLQAELSACTEFLESLDEIYVKYTYDYAVEEHQKLSKELEELKSKLDGIADFEPVEDVSERLEASEAHLHEEQKHLAELSANIKAATNENERYHKELDSLSEKKKELDELEDKIFAYNFIEDAFSNNGIPAIELRESAPEITDIANRILSDSYGNKFEIRFGSTSELKTKRKANEDFNIIVYDTENGDEKTIDLVSSGEKIWIKQALFYAFSIVQMNRTGFNFRTRLIDESDGSLDGGLRPKYLQMVTSAHRIADSRVTILITHSQEIKDIASQIIEI